MKQPYAMGVMATKIQNSRLITVFTSGIVFADNEFEAEGKALAMARERWPDYTQYQASLTELPESTLQRIVDFYTHDLCAA